MASGKQPFVGNDRHVNRPDRWNTPAPTGVVPPGDRIVKPNQNPNTPKPKDGTYSGK